MDYNQIIWIASYPKSGNTWVRMFLEAYYTAELDINEMVCSVADDTVYRHQIGDGSDPRKYPVGIQQLTRPMALVRMVRAYDEHKLPGLPLFVKTHNAHMITNGIEQLPEELTKATIHIVRDPRDVLPSFSKHMGCDHDQGLEYMKDKFRVLFGEEAMKMADFISDWATHTKSFLNADTHNVKTFRYEDMRENPVDNFCDMLAHAGVEPDRKRVRQALKMVDIKNIQEKEKKDGFKESSPKNKDGFFSGGGKVGWKDKISIKHAKQLEKAFSTTMKRLNYVDSLRRVV
jgi:hypothetical protein